VDAVKVNGNLKVILAMALFGSIGVFVKNINLPSMEIAFLRSAIASIALILWGVMLRSTRIGSENGIKNVVQDRKSFLYLAASGALLGINWVMVFQAYKFTTLSNANLVYYFSPVFVILFSPFLFNEKLTKIKVISVLVAVGGLAMILFNQPQNTGGSYNHLLGVAYALAGGSMYAVMIFLNKKIENVSGPDRTKIQITAAALVLLPFVLFRNQIHITDIRMLMFILILGLVHTAFGLSLYFSAMNDVKAQNIALFSYIDPISAVIWGVLIFQDNINAFQIIGGLLILVSTYFGSRTKEEGSKVSSEMQMDLKEIENLVDTVYGVVGEKYSEQFKSITGGCHCIPPTEWYGDVYLAFKKIIKDDAIKDERLKKQMRDELKYLSKWF
jgi:drug/metabolite transporter (DMT)-like permease